MKSNRARERILDELDDWESGRKATVGQPNTGEAYARVVRENRKRLLAQLRKIDQQLGNALPEHVYR